MPLKIDDNDRKILSLLKKQADLTVSQISKKINLPMTTVHNRIKKLKENKVIKNYTVNLNHELLGEPLVAYVLLTVNYHSMEKAALNQHSLAQKIRCLFGVESVAIVTGGKDILIRVRICNIKELDKFLLSQLRSIKGVDKTETLVVLHEE